jgi:hypothetical protein
MRGFIAIMMLCVAQLLSAQIRIIPQDVVRKATEIEAIDSLLQFSPSRVDFGIIDEMSGVWQGNARLQNICGDTLVITQVKSTCGCLRAEVTKRTLTPKERVNVTLKYYPRGHAGRVRQRVLVYTNSSSDTPSAVLNLTGLVTAAQDRSDDYPYTRGVLRLRQERVVLNGNERQVQRIACMNGGSTTLRPEVDGNFLPKGVSVRFEPSTFAPKQEGDMIVEYQPQGVEISPKSTKLYIKGLGVAPRESAIDIVIEN